MRNHRALTEQDGLDSAFKRPMRHPAKRMAFAAASEHKEGNNRVSGARRTTENVRDERPDAVKNHDETDAGNAMGQQVCSPQKRTCAH